MPDSHATSIAEEGKFVRADQEDPIAEAARLHHLATADPEPDRDGILTSKDHEEKYGLERASDLSVRTAVPLETAEAPRAKK